MYCVADGCMSGGVRLGWRLVGKLSRAWVDAWGGAWVHGWGCGDDEVGG